jgi:hypothetical protein
MRGIARGDIVTIRRLWALKLSEGPEVIANLFYDPDDDDATLEITVKAAHAEDIEAIKLSDIVRDSLDAQGAKPMVEG